MSRRQKPKLIEPDKLKIEPIDDEFTMDRLDKLRVAELPEDIEPPASALAGVPEEKRAEVTRVLRSRNARMRAYIAGESDGSDW